MKDAVVFRSKMDDHALEGASVSAGQGQPVRRDGDTRHCESGDRDSRWTLVCLCFCLIKESFFPCPRPKYTRHLRVSFLGRFFSPFKTASSSVLFSHSEGFGVITMDGFDFFHQKELGGHL